MKINIPNYISTRTYFLKDKNILISFILNIKTNIEYSVKNELSELWNIIVKEKDYDVLYNYAKKNGLENILDDFLSELKDKDLIFINKNFRQSDKNYLSFKISRDSDFYFYYDNIKSKILTKNQYIRTICLVLGYKCNLKCKHCCNPKDRDNEKISFKQAKKIIDEAYNLGIDQILLTGGECTLNKDFLKIARYARSKYLNLIILTNGQQLYDDENLFNKVLDLYTYSIHLSLYSLNPKIHDNVTSIKGSQKKTLSVINKLRNNNRKVLILNFLSSYNTGCNNEVKEFANSINSLYETSCLFFYRPQNNNYNAALSEEEMEKYYFDKIDISLNYKKFKKDNGYICNSGRNQLSVEPNLDVTPCIYNNYILGNIKETSLKEIAETTLIEFRQKYITQNLTECFKYDYCEYCNYCSVGSSINKGFMKKDEIFCRNAKAIQKAFQKHKTLPNNKQ